MPDIERADVSNKITLRKSAFYYTAFMFMMIMLVKVSANTQWLPGFIPLSAYFVFGFFLNRIVLRKLITWHPVYNTLANVSAAKLSAFLFWPVSYLFLFIRISVNKIL